MTPQNKGGRPVGMVLPYRPVSPKHNKDRGTLRVTLDLDSETFGIIDLMARQSNCRVTRMVTTLIEVGLAELEKGSAS